MNTQIDEMSKDLNKRLCSTALQKDLAFMSSVLDKKADNDFVNEALA